MKKLLFLLSVSLFLFACNSSPKNDTSKKHQITEVYSLSDGENTLARQEYQNLRLQNPNTGVIPENIKINEFNFVQQMPNLKSNSNFEWQSRGPNNVGGRTRAIAIDVSNENRILAGGVSGGLWLSENGGDSYTKVTTNLMLHSVTSIAQDTRVGNQNVWYYGTGELSGNSSDLIGHGIYKSIDNGLTWNLLPSTFNDSANIVSNLGDFSYVQDVKVNPINGDVLVASFAGIFISKDGGDTWQNVLKADNSPNGFNYVNFGNQTSVNIDPNGMSYASLSSDAQDRGIWRSMDGITWTNITPTGFSNAYRRMEFDFNPFNNNEVMFIVDASTNPQVNNHELWLYTYLANNGNGVDGNWENKSANLPSGDCLGFYDFNFGFYQSQSSYDMLIAYHPSQADVVFLGGTNLYRSTDAFSSTNNTTWIGGYQCDAAEPSNYVWPNHHPDNHAVLFLPSNDSVMFSATDGGISKTSNCLATSITWELKNNGYNTSQFYTIAIDQSDVADDFIMGGLQDNGTWHTTSSNPNQDWISTFYGDGSYCAVADNKENYYVSWQGGKTFKFDIENDGSINALTRIDPASSTEDYLFINPFILDPNNSNTMYFVEGKYIWKNDSLDAIPLINDEYNGVDLGWERITVSSAGGSTFFPAYISALDMSKANSDVLYYGVHNGNVFKLTGLLTNNPVKTSIKRTGMPDAYVSCIVANPANENELLITYSNYEVLSIFHSLDGGDTWENVSGTLEENPDGSGAGPSVNWAHFYQQNNDSLYFVGTTSGLFSTKKLDGANTVWEREAVNEIGNVPVTMIKSRIFDNNVVVATHGAGVFSNKVVEVGIADQLNDASNQFDVSFPYPNPNNGKFSFNIALHQKMNIKISLFDLLGKQISSIEKNDFNLGTNTYKMLHPDLPNGIYYLLISNGTEKITRQVLVNKD